MQESLRQYYLNQLGVTSYQSRMALPGAAPSIVALDGIDAEEVDADLQLENVKPQTAHFDNDASTELPTNSSIKSAVVELNHIDEAKTSRRSVRESFDKNALQKPTQTVKGYRFSVWRLAQDMLVVDGTPPNLALPTHQLLKNIVLALGYSLEELSVPEALSWPPKNVVLDPVSSEEEGRGMLQAYFEGQVSTRGFRSVMLMGEAAIYFSLSPESVALAEPKQLYGQTIKLDSLSTSSHSVSAVLVPSLAEMLQQPLTKKTTWRAIQALIRKQI